MEMTREEQLLCARAIELAGGAAYTTTATAFLTPRERLLVHDALIQAGLAENCFFWGGCRSCDRTMAIFPAAYWQVEDWLATEAPVVKGGFAGAMDEAREDYFVRMLTDIPGFSAEIPLTSLQITGSGFATLSHRDFMGAILALGIERSVLGEIVVDSTNVDEAGALVFTTPEMASYLIENLTKIGRDAVAVRPCSIDPTGSVPRQYENLSVTAASPRVDGVVRALTNLSREDAATMVRAGLVERNYEPIEDVDKQLHAGDVLTIRGYGKYRIDRTDEETKRGRKRILCRKYK